MCASKAFVVLANRRGHNKCVYGHRKKVAGFHNLDYDFSDSLISFIFHFCSKSIERLFDKSEKYF